MTPTDRKVVDAALDILGSDVSIVRKQIERNDFKSASRGLQELRSRLIEIEAIVAKHL